MTFTFFSSVNEINLIIKNIYYKLIDIIKSHLNIKISVLPDFFIDRVVKFSNVDQLTEAIGTKIKVGGGSIRGFNSFDIKGGNAVNVAYCLANLGIKVDLFTVADKIGSSILNTVFEKFKSQVNLHIKNGKHGLTTIFEFSDLSFSVTNVMLSDVGDNRNFGPEYIESATAVDILQILNSSSAVVLTNWASNLRGTDLLKYVFTNSLNSMHFLDPADISERRSEFIQDLKDCSKLIDFLSINENEYRQIIYALSNTNDTDILNNNEGCSITPVSLCKSSLSLSKFFEIEICIHTSIGSVLSNGYNSVFVKSIPPSKIEIVSGAGDSWDAAFLFGHLLNFTNEEKLCFANLVAFLYLENIYTGAPSLQNVIDYIQNYYLI